MNAVTRNAVTEFNFVVLVVVMSSCYAWGARSARYLRNSLVNYNYLIICTSVSSVDVR